MTSTVRIAIAEQGTPLAWPNRCAACASTSGLVPSTTRVGRVKSVRPNLGGGITMKSDVMYVSAPMCAAHAGPNVLANKILEKSPLMSMLRGWVSIGAVFAIVLLVSVALGRKGSLLDLGGMLLFPLIGIIGTAAIAWARANTHVRPVRFDPDMDVVEVDFRDDTYAAEFKRANRKATDMALTEPLPWYRRSATWKAVVLALFVFVMWRLIRRG